MKSGACWRKKVICLYKFYFRTVRVENQHSVDVALRYKNVPMSKTIFLHIGEKNLDIIQVKRVAANATGDAVG